MSVMIFLLTAWSSLIAMNAHAGDNITVEQDGYKFEIKVDPQQKKVTVNPLIVTQKLPSEMSISLFRDQSTGETYQLQAVSPLKSGDAPQYQGKIDWYSGPYVAFELQIPLQHHSWKRIKKPVTLEK